MRASAFYLVTQKEAPAEADVVSQKLMLRSRSNALLSVRRVAEVNAGRTTAGVDGKVALLASRKAELADWVQHPPRSWTALPVKRVFIPKSGSTKLPWAVTGAVKSYAEFPSMDEYGGLMQAYAAQGEPSR